MAEETNNKEGENIDKKPGFAQPVSVPERQRQNHTVWVVLGSVLVLGIIAAAVTFARFDHTNKIYRQRGFVGIGREMPAGGGMMRGGRMMGGRDGVWLRGALSGQIDSVNGNKITVKDSDGTDYTVNIADSTSIYSNGKIAKLSDLKSGNNVIVFGPSNSAGEVNATMIQVRS